MQWVSQAKTYPPKSHFFQLSQEEKEKLEAMGYLATQENEDHDNDGFLNDEDNCPQTPNSTTLGSCVKFIHGVITGTGEVCLDEGGCKVGETCRMGQEDYNGNGIGDVCECYGDCNCDTIVDVADSLILKQELGRDDCATNPCRADCNRDGKVTNADLEIIRTQFNRRDCPPCP